MNNVPPVDVDGAICVGALNGELGCANPPPLGFPNPPELGRFAVGTAGDAGCDEPKENAFVGGAAEGVNENCGAGWNVDGLLGVELVCPNGLLAGALGPPKLNGEGPLADVGVVEKPNEPAVDGRGASAPVDLDGPKENKLAAGVAVEVCPNPPKDLGSSLCGSFDANGFACCC